MEKREYYSEDLFTCNNSSYPEYRGSPCLCANCTGCNSACSNCEGPIEECDRIDIEEQLKEP